MIWSSNNNNNWKWKQHHSHRKNTAEHPTVLTHLFAQIKNIRIAFPKTNLRSRSYCGLSTEKMFWSFFTMYNKSSLRPPLYALSSGTNSFLYGYLPNGPDNTNLMTPPTDFCMDRFTSLKISSEFSCKNVFILSLSALLLNRFSKYGMNLEFECERKTNNENLYQFFDAYSGDLTYFDVLNSTFTFSM